MDQFLKPDRISSYWFQEKGTVLLILIFGLLFNTAIVLGPILQGTLIDTLVNQAPMAVILKQISRFIATILAIQGCRFMKRYFVRRFANRTSMAMRQRLYRNIINQPPRQLDQENIGDLMTRIMGDVALCVEGMRKVTTEIFDTVVLMLSYLVAMASFDGKITLLSCLFIPVAMLLAELLKGYIYKYTLSYRQASSALTDLTYDNIRHALLLRRNGLEPLNRRKYEQALQSLQHKAIQANLLENTMQPLYNVIALIGILPLIYLGSTQVILGNWTVGNFSAYLLMFTAITTKASKAAKLFNSAQKSRISWLRLKPYLAMESSQAPPSPSQAPQPAAASLVVSNLSFTYKNQRSSTLSGISFQAHSGQILGITGPVACGKSTLGLALLGLYPYQGSVRLDNEELADWSPAQRGQLLGYLSHQPQLLSDTIYHNITLDHPGNIEAVLQHVGLDKDLETMAQGIHTLVGSGGLRLSGGQQSRLALARALYLKPKLLILDDPFAALDRHTETAILANLRRYYSQSIILLIAHGLRCFPSLDQIILLQKNQAPQIGRHTYLLTHSPLYATLYGLQEENTGENHETP